MKLNQLKPLLFSIVLATLNFAQASTDLNQVYCLAVKAKAYPTIFVAGFSFVKTKSDSASHFTSVTIGKKIYKLYVQELNNSFAQTATGFTGINTARLDVWNSEVSPDNSNPNNIRFDGTATYTNSNYRSVVNIYGGGSQYRIFCNETNDADLEEFQKTQNVKIERVP